MDNMPIDIDRIGQYNTPRQLNVSIQTTQRPALPARYVDPKQNGTSGFLRKRREMTNAERKLLMLIANTVFRTLFIGIKKLLQIVHDNASVIIPGK